MVKRAMQVADEAAAAAIEGHAAVHEAQRRLDAAEIEKQAALAVASYRITHQVSYTSSLIDVDVGTFEKVLAELAGIDEPKHVFVDVVCLGAQNVLLKSTLIAYATKQLLHALTRSTSSIEVMSILL